MQMGFEFEQKMNADGKNVSVVFRNDFSMKLISEQS